MIVRRGGCLCGAVRYEATAQPRDVHFCHCTMCRRATGNAFATIAWFYTRDLAWPAGTPAEYRSSSIARRGFCGACGTPLYLVYDGVGQTGIMAGTLDAPADLEPSHHYGIESRLPWATIGEELPGRPTAPDPRPRTD